MKYFIVTIAISIAIYLVGSRLRKLSPIKSVYIEVGPKIPLEGPYARNEILTNHGEQVAKGKLLGPESIAITYDGSYIYTSSRNGSILVISTKDQSTKEISRIPSQICEPKQSFCIAPLGMRLSQGESTLFIMDSYNGLYKVKLELQTFLRAPDLLPIERVFPTLRNSENFSFLLFDDFDILADGSFVISESSTQFNLENFAYDVLQGKANGRLLKFDPQTEKHCILADNLHFPNGVQTHPDGESVLIAEGSRNRILRYYYAGNKIGIMETFLALPGSPDNIRMNGNQDGFWIALFVSQDTYWWLALPTWIRDLVALVLDAQSLARMAVNKFGFAVEVDLEGNVLQSIQDPEGNVTSSITEVSEAKNGDLYFGSIHNDFVVRLEKKFVKST